MKGQHMKHIAVYIFILAAGASTAQASDTLTLQSPQASADAHSLVLTWTPPNNIQNIQDYRILKNGQIIGTATQNNTTASSKPFIDQFYKNNADKFTQKIVWQSAKIQGLSAQSNYQFQVQAIDKNGKVIEKSNALTLKTTAQPTKFNILSYGAKGDGKTNNTHAIQEAINNCPTNCELTVPTGKFVTGAIFLKSNMTLKLDKGATLLGSTNADDYPTINKKPSALINIHQSSATNSKKFKDIRIVGQGVIDGNGWKQTSDTYRNYLNQPQPHYLHASNKLYVQYGLLAKTQVEKGIQDGLSEHKSYSSMRSNLLYLRKVSGLYLEGITLRNPANHAIASSSNKNATYNGIRVETFDSNNGDGIDIGRGSNTTVMNSYFDVGDDAINFAAGAGAKAAKQDDVDGAWLFNNFIYHAHGGVVLGSRTGSGIHHILAENNVMVKTDIALRAKSSDSIGGGASDITFRNTATADLADNFMVLTLQYGDPNDVSSYKPASKPAQFADFHVDHVSVNTIEGSKPSIKIETGFTHSSFHKNIYLNEVRLRNVMPTNIKDLKDSHFNKVNFTELKSSSTPWHFQNTSNVKVDGIKG